MTESRRPTCTIHIGPPKTGSSSIKHFIWGNEDRLEELGLFVPKLIGPKGKRARNHEDLAKTSELTPGGDLKPSATLWREIEPVADAGEKNILLSSEMFCRSLSEPEIFGRILAFFEKRGYRVVILAYMRDQPAWLNSWFVQSQKRLARLLTFDEFVEEAAGLGRCEPDRYLAPFLEDKRCEVDVVQFDQAAKAGLEADFIRRCGVEIDDTMDVSALRNSNAGAKTLYAAQEIMRRMDMADGLKLIPGYPKVYNDFKRRARELDWDETPFVALDQAQYEAIRARFAESNDVFARKYFGASWTELCPPRTYERSVFDPNVASAEEVAEVEKVVAEVVQKFETLRKIHGGPTKNKKERKRVLA